MMIDKEKAAQMRRNGMTYKAIGKEFGVTRQRVQQLLKTEGYKRKCTTDIERIPYEGLYNWMAANERMTFTALAAVMFGRSSPEHHARAMNFAHGRNCLIRKKAYDRLLAKTGMTYEELFKLRDGFKEEEA